MGRKWNLRISKHVFIHYIWHPHLISPKKMLLWEVTVARTPSGWRFHGSKMTQFLFLIKNDSENTLRKVFDDFENFFSGGGRGVRATATSLWWNTKTWLYNIINYILFWWQDKVENMQKIKFNDQMKIRISVKNGKNVIFLRFKLLLSRM